MSIKAVRSAVQTAMGSFEGGQALQQALHADVLGFEKLARILLTSAGIHLPTNDKNISLMAGRVGPILRERGLRSYGEYRKLLLESSSPEPMNEFICALTTNTTEFFRECKHYEYLREMLPPLLSEKQSRGPHEIRVWCSAASTGQEPYSILMTLLETVPSASFWDLRFLATDIDLDVLQRAAEGTYTEAEMKNVPGLHRQQYFDTLENQNGEKVYQVCEEQRNKIRFAQMNLLNMPYPFQHQFDVIFCRNVLIYFERQTANDVVEAMARTLRPGGLLFLGHSETGAGRTPLLKTIAPAVYVRVKGDVK